MKKHQYISDEADVLRRYTGGPLERCDYWHDVFREIHVRAGGAGRMHPMLYPIIAALTGVEGIPFPNPAQEPVATEPPPFEDNTEPPTAEPADDRNGTPQVPAAISGFAGSDYEDCRGLVKGNMVMVHHKREGVIPGRFQRVAKGMVYVMTDGRQRAAAFEPQHVHIPDNTFSKKSTQATV